jgi:hypothetical protein
MCSSLKNAKNLEIFVFAFIKENMSSENTIFVIIWKMALRKRVRNQKENKLRILFLVFENTKFSIVIFEHLHTRSAF